MITHLQELLAQSLATLRARGELVLDDQPRVPVERTRGGAHGDFASPVALGLAKAARRRPRDIAELLVAHLPSSTVVARVEVAGPGFINFHVVDGAFQELVGEILASGEAYGRGQVGAGQRVQVEFVSANPTGPLHVGHGRGAAYGSVLASLLEAAGFDVEREYYVNDAGRQMGILAASVWLRYLQARGIDVPFPVNAYRGEYVREMARALDAQAGDALVREARAVGDGLPPDEPAGGDKEIYVDAVVARARALLGAAGFAQVYELAVRAQVDEIRGDLAEFNVEYDRWFSERSLVDGGAIDRVVGRLRAAGHLYERDGAVWFRSSAFGDEKDRVVVRETGEGTYFASDLAYLADKFARGFDRVIYVWGADHHGYVARLLAACDALGLDRARVEILLVQFASLVRGGARVAMSTRAGEFVTLRELREEVGTDAARFFYVMRRCEQHMDFDLDLAKSESNDNPVYYVQYAHARISSVLRQAEERGKAFSGVARGLERLGEEHELALIKTLSRYPEVVEAAALAREPHQVAFYLREMATDFHTYYNAHTFLVDDEELREARLALVTAARQVMRNGLALIGVGAPETM